MDQDEPSEKEETSSFTKGLKIAITEGPKGLFVGLRSHLCRPIRADKESCDHHENMPIQYTANFSAVNNEKNSVGKKVLFCSKHRLWIHVRTASARRF